MDRELTPAEIEDLFAAYSIDAVDDDERAAVEEYLTRDPDARADVGDLQRAASYLAYTGGPPPPGVWEQLETKLAGGEPGESPAPPRLVPRARRARSSQPWRWVAAAAVVAALVFAALWLVSRDDSSGSDLAALASSAEHESGARHADLVDADGTVLARAVVLRDGTGYLNSSLPALPGGRTYQLWGLGERAPISLGVMGRDPNVVAFHVAGRPSKLAVTNERAGGVAASTQDPAAVGDVT